MEWGYLATHTRVVLHYSNSRQIVPIDSQTIRVLAATSSPTGSYNYFSFLVISPEMTCKTGQSYIPDPCGVSIFKTLRLRDHWSWDKTSRKRNFERWLLHCVGEMTHTEWGDY